MRNPTSFFVLLFVFISSFVNAQGIIRGKVADESGESLIGAIVSLKSNGKIAVLTDLDGNYSIKIPDSIPPTLMVTYVSYKTIEQPMPALKKNQVLIRSFTLLSQNNLEEVEIVAKQVRASNYYMENIKKNSATTIDYISSETMKKTGDQNVVSAVARVSGVATSGGLITVRGIGDRYVKTMLNGSRIPTLDPLTNNIKLDIFPASLVDNIVITKTASPDLPGDWAGAYLSVETKDYPEKLVVNVESQFGYNAQTTFQEVLTSQRSATDWLGFDSGLRDKSHENFKAPNGNRLQTTTYEEMAALGLGNYYNSIGIKSWNDDASTQSDNYFRLGLVQLGLLPANQINDETLYNAARLKYNAEYKPKAFGVIYPDGTDFNNNLKANWNTFKRRAPINFSQNFSVGNQTVLFKKPFGYVLGMRYGSSIRYDPNGVSLRVGPGPDYLFELQDNALISRETNGWSALANLSYKLNDKNSVSLLFMPNLTGTNDVASFESVKQLADPITEGRRVQNQFYEQRKQMVYQLKSEHYIKGPKMKIDFNASYTKGNSIVPDFKVLEYVYQIDNQTNQIYSFQFSSTAGDGFRRFFRYLADDILDTRLSGELPIGDQTKAGVRKIKFGGAYLQNDRRQDLYEYIVRQGNSLSQPPLTGRDSVDVVLNTNNFIVENGSANYVYERLQRSLIGKSTVKSVFLMTDYSLFSFLRVSGGLRVEQADLFSDDLRYHQLGYKADDKRRINDLTFPNILPANINETSLLPSANMVIKVLERQAVQINTRLNYSKTLARPSLRELNDAAIFDNEFRTAIYGNSDLKTVRIDNYDFRLESYFKNGDNVSISLFYKNFVNHIEMVFGNSALTWNNVGKSTVRGIEFEGRKKLGKSFELRANVTLTKSNSNVILSIFEVVEGTKVYIPTDELNRPMFGQAPYIINGIFSYTSEKLGLTATASYNVQGPRLVISGIIPGFPDVYEMPRNTVDMKISKTIGKHFAVSATVRDLLNAPVLRAYKYVDKDGKIADLVGGPIGDKYFDNFRYGTNYLLTLAYKM